MRYIFIAFAALGISSAHAAPPAAGLSDAEQEYYEKVFDYAMGTVKPGETYKWESYGGKGEIAPGENFVSKSKAVCRNFTESYAIGGKQGKADGIACRREGREGWCRLKEGNALTCALEETASDMQKRLKDANDVAAVGKSWTERIRGWFGF